VNPTIAKTSKMMIKDKLAMQPLKILWRPDVVSEWKLVTLEETYPEDNVP
jgi:hypothetical protein